MIRAILLAAGKGTRMKSARPKVLHDLCGRPMLWYAIAALRAAGIEEIVAVIGPELLDEITSFGVESVVQEPQLGTGDAVRVAPNLAASCSKRSTLSCSSMPRPIESRKSASVMSIPLDVASR